MRSGKVSADPIKRGRGGSVIPVSKQRNPAPPINKGKPGERFTVDNGKNALQAMFQKQLNSQRKGG